MALTAKERATFTAVVDTLLPAVDGDGPAWTTPGGDLGFGERLPEVYARLPHDQDRKDLRQFLDSSTPASAVSSSTGSRGPSSPLTLKGVPMPSVAWRAIASV